VYYPRPDTDVIRHLGPSWCTGRQGRKSGTNP